MRKPWGIGTSIEEYHAKEAKGRQGVRTELPTNPNISQNSDEGETSKHKAAKAVDWNRETYLRRTERA